MDDLMPTLLLALKAASSIGLILLLLATNATDARGLGCHKHPSATTSSAGSSPGPYAKLDTAILSKSSPSSR